MNVLVEIPEKYVPSIESLPDGLPWIANEVEGYLPGKGIAYALLMAQVFRGQRLYIRSIDSQMIQIRNRAVNAEFKAGVAHSVLRQRFGLSVEELAKVLLEEGK